MFDQVTLKDMSQIEESWDYFKMGKTFSQGKHVNAYEK